MNRVCPKTKTACTFMGCTDDVCFLASGKEDTPDPEYKTILNMKLGDRKVINTPTTFDGKDYQMKTCVTRVFRGWLFVEVDGGAHPITWFVQD